MGSSAIDRVRINSCYQTYLLFDPPEGEPCAIFHQNLYIIVEIFGEDNRLVDQNMILRLPEGAVETVRQRRWDALSIDQLPVGISTIEIESGDNFFAAIDFDVVDEIDMIAPSVEIYADPKDPITVGYWQKFCFKGQANGVVVAGLDWEFSITGNIEINEGYGFNCILVRGNEVTTGSLLVSAGGYSMSFPLVVVDAMPATAPDTHVLNDNTDAKRFGTPGIRAQFIH